MPVITRRPPSAGPAPSVPASAPHAPSRVDAERAVHARDVDAPRPVDVSVLGGARRTTEARRTTGVTLAEGVSLAGGRLIVDGFAAAGRALLKRSGGRALVSAAARVCGGPAIGKLAASARAGLVEELLPVLRLPSSGRASRHDVSARSGAFALLEECLLCMRGRGEKRAADDLAAALLQAAAAERHPGLRAHMERRIARLPARVVPAADRETVDALRLRHAHEQPLRERWLKGEPPTLRVLASVQDEFWKEQLQSLRDRGFEVSTTSSKHATARRVVTDVEPPATIEIDLRQRDTEVFDGLHDRDVDVVVYTGHANLGGVAKAGLAHGPRSANGDKLIALLACRSKQNLDAVERRYPGQHLVVSDQGTYGHDDEIVLHHLLDGIVRGKSYAQMEAAAKREGLWESKNYHFPHETAALVGDERVYVPTSKTAVGRSISMRPRSDPPPASSVPPGPVDDAVAWLNTIQGYWAEQSGTPRDKALHDKIVSKGWFDPRPGDPLVKVEIVDGTAAVSVSAALAHQDPDAIGMIVSFVAGQALVAHGDPKRSTHDQRMLGLAMVSSYVYFLVEYSDSADALLRQFAKTFGFPPGLSWPTVEKSVQADHENDCSAKSIAVLERGMEHTFLEVNPARTSSRFRRTIGAALTELLRSDTKIGQLTHELIVTGQVKVDELDDLTRADYMRVRQELAKSGVDIPANRDALDDKRGKAWRAITTDMNGYMWDDRIYVAPGLSPRELASILVHEVNHVRNESEAHYRGEQAVFVEEYRAAYAEALFRDEKLSAARCREIKEGVIRDYGLKDVTADDVSDRPPGILDE